MSRAQLFYLLLLISAILVIAIVLLSLDRIRTPKRQTDSSPQPAKFVEGENGYFNVGQSTVHFYAQVDKIDKENDSVIAGISILRDYKISKHRIIIYDPRLAQMNSLNISDEPNSLYKNDQILLGNAKDAYAKTQIMIGKVSFFVLGLKTPLHKDAIECNRKFLTYLQGSKEILDCIPVSVGLAVYAK